MNCCYVMAKKSRIFIALKFRTNSMKFISSITAIIPHAYLISLNPCNIHVQEKDAWKVQLLFLADWILEVTYLPSVSQEVTRITNVFPRKREALEWEMAIIKVIRKERFSYQGRNESAASLNTNWTMGVSLMVAYFERVWCHPCSESSLNLE